MDNNKQVLTPYDVAKICDIGLSLVYRQLKAGVIPCVKVGDKYLISRSAFEKWLSGDKRQAVAEFQSKIIAQ
jgi:excisionase family DNA binding protein